MGRMRKDSGSKREHFQGQHHFECWYRDNALYFISSKVRGGFNTFAQELAPARPLNGLTSGGDNK